MQDGTFLKFYVQEKRKLHGRLAYEWLIEQARAAGLPGATVCRAIAGYGREGVLHENQFFELAGDVPVEVNFVLSNLQADEFLQRLHAARVGLFYMRLPVTYGSTDDAPPPAGT
jgi:PII-like signaling protein